jgi:hypothetical protein
MEAPFGGEERRQKREKRWRQVKKEERREQKIDRRWKMEAKGKMPGLRRGFLGGRRFVSDKCLLNSTLCPPRYTQCKFHRTVS